MAARVAAKRYKIPTGIKSLDLATGGGIQPGSLVLLYGPAKTLKSEFLSTVAFTNAALRDGHIAPPRGAKIPKGTWYVALSKGEEEISLSVKDTFNKKFYEIFKRGVRFMDLSEEYSALSATTLWEAKPRVKRPRDKYDFLKGLVTTLKKIGQDNQIFIYTLTDVARLYQDSPNEFLPFVEGLRAASKGWGGVVYAILRKGMLPTSMEEDILSTVGGVIYFETERVGVSKERYTMHLLGLSGVPASALGLVFEISVTPDGFLAEVAKSIMGA